MATAEFELRLSGGLSDNHEIEGYDGFRALAGAAFAVSLVANYVETGKVRHKGNFKLRHAVIAKPMRAGSLITNLEVPLSAQIDPSHRIASGSPLELLYGLMKRVIGGNIGIENPALNRETTELITKKGGDVEALISATEPALRQSHEVIGSGAAKMEWTGGFHSVATLNHKSKLYMNDSIPDDTLRHKDVSVSGFLGNSGRGLVFDRMLGRNVSISMNMDTLRSVGTYFSYGLDQYMRKTGNLVRIFYTRVDSVDGRPKRYIIHDAKVTQMAGVVVD